MKIQIHYLTAKKLKSNTMLDENDPEYYDDEDDQEF